MISKTLVPKIQLCEVDCHNLIVKTPFEKLSTSIWLYNIAKQLNISHFTLLCSFNLWLKFGKNGQDSNISAISSLSLLCKYQESSIILLSTLAKCANKKVSDINNEEDFLMTQCKGLILGNIYVLNKIKDHLLFFSLLACDYEYDDCQNIIENDFKDKILKLTEKIPELKTYWS
jgi:hypothetical protein